MGHQKGFSFVDLMLLVAVLIISFGGLIAYGSKNDDPVEVIKSNSQDQVVIDQSTQPSS